MRIQFFALLLLPACGGTAIKTTPASSAAQHAAGPNDVKAFIHQWFSWFDRQAEEDFFIAHLSHEGLVMRYPEVTLRSRAQFRDWYRGIRRKIAVNTHDVGGLEVARTPVGFEVRLIVFWQARTRAGEAVALWLRQKLELVDSGGRLIIQRLEVYPINPDPPPQIRAAIGTTLVAGGASGTRISENYVLSAAHCAFGYTGNENRPMTLRLGGGRAVPVRIVESGRFHPDRGEMADWLVLEPIDGPTALSGIAIASFPTREEIAWIERTLAGKTASEEIALWGLTYPAPTVRTFPRRATLKGERMVSRGRLLTDLEFQQRAAQVMSTGQIYDDASGWPFPSLPAGALSIWNDPHGRASSTIVSNYWSYRNDRKPLLYHTADYAPGSSGGGFFLERSGHYLGLVPMGATGFHRGSNFAGFGGLYRVDKICAQSKVLGELPGCRALLGGQGAKGGETRETTTP